MAIAPHPAPPALLTYETYLTEGETPGRYDIVDGVREYMNPTRMHQEVLLNLGEIFRGLQRQTHSGRTIPAPCDILIRYSPLRTRQPDILFISNERLAQNPPATDPAPLKPAPELVVEILSPSDTPKVLEEKIADYCVVDVKECWIIKTDTKTVEIWQLAPTGTTQIATAGTGEEVISQIFAGLRVPVDAIFAE